MISHLPNFPNYSNYQQQYPNYQNYPQQAVRRKLDFVQGRTSADTYPVNAGEEVFLVDMDNPNVYRKARGFDNILEPMLIFDLVEHKDEEPKQFDFADYTKDLETRINKEVEKKIKAEVDKRLSEISFTPAKKTTAKKGE